MQERYQKQNEMPLLLSLLLILPPHLLLPLPLPLPLLLPLPLPLLLLLPLPLLPLWAHSTHFMR